MNNIKEKPSYGNWVPKKLMVMIWVIAIAFIALAAVSRNVWNNIPLTAIFAVLGVLMIIYALYMKSCRNIFSYEGGKLMSKVHDFLLSRLKWDGQGKLLDIGCGSGALTINCANRFPDAEIVGTDYWGATWDYAKEQCENNAKLACADNIEFVKGDARELPFESESFDAAVSNFVFHEVRSEKDKRKLVREALRVVKKGGVFVFHDLFESRRLYGNMDEFIKMLKEEGISEVHYEARTENQPFIPKTVKTPMMLNHLGLLYGIK